LINLIQSREPLEARKHELVTEVHLSPQRPACTAIAILPETLARFRSARSLWLCQTTSGPARSLGRFVPWCSTLA